MGDHWTESTSPLSASRVVPFVVDVAEFPHSQKAFKSGQSIRRFFLGRRWLDGGKFMLRKGLHVDRSNGLQVLLPVSENSASATSSVVLRRTGSVKFAPAFVPTGFVVNLCQDYSCQPTILEEEFNVAVRDVNGLVLHTSPVPGFFDSHPESSLRFYHNLPAWVCGIVEKGRALDMGGSQKSTRGKLHCKATADVAGETERTYLWTNRTNSPIEEEIEKYVCYTFATDAPVGWIEPDSNGLYSKEALAYFSGGGAKRIDALTSLETRGAMESSRGGLSKSFSMRNLGVEEHHLKSQQEFLEREELANGKGATDLLSGYGSWDQTCTAIQSESEGSYEVGSSPVFDESFYMGPTQLEAELQATSDAIEEMEGKVAIRLMVAEAVLKGIVRAVEVDASEAVEVSETELLKVKQELQDKDSTVIKLINTLKKKEEELVKLVEESRRKERRLVMDMLTERERILGKVKESDKYVAQKEKELLKMAEHMIELSLNLAAESKRVNVLEKQVRESKEAEALKGRELLVMMEKTEQFRAEKESIVEVVRREARLKELRLTESLSEKETVLSQQFETIMSLETAEQQLREELDVRSQKELQLSETLAEKEKLVSQHLQAINALETVEQQLREELDARTQKELQLTQSLDEKVTLVSELVRSLESAEEDLKEKLISQSMKVQDLTEELENLTEDLSAKEQQLSKQLETIKSLELAEKELSKVVENQGQKERFLMGELLEKDELISKHLTTITTLESAGQELRKEAEVQREKVNALLQSGNDTSEVLDKLRDTVRFHAEEKDRSLRLLQNEIEVLNGKIKDLSSVHSTLTENIKSYELEGENQRQQIVKQEAIIRESETRCQELCLAEKRLQDKLAALNEKVLEHVDAAQRAEEELREESWKLEAEIALIMTTLEGRVMDLEREINLLGEESARNQVEAVTFKSQTLQKRFLEISNLRSSKASLEAKLLHAQAAVEALEEITKKEKEESVRKDHLLEKADRRIAQLEQKLIENEVLFQGFEKEMEEMKVSEENLKKQQKVSESEVQQVRQDLDRITLLEQEVRAKEFHLRNVVEELEGKVWRLEFEYMSISSYMENSSQDFLNLVADVNKRLTASAEALVLLQHELEAAGVELSKSKEEVDTLRWENVELSACVERMQSNLESSAMDIAEARAGLEDETAKSPRMKAHVCESQSRIEGLLKELGCKLSRKEEEAMQLVWSLEECKWQNHVESFIILGLAEGSIQTLMESLGHAREEIKNKSEDVDFLRCEVEELSQKVRAQASDISELKLALSSKIQELVTFKTDFVLQNAMQRDALVQEQSQAKEALRKFEELKRMKLTLLDRIQEEKLRRVQLEEALAEQKLKYQVEMDIVSTVMYEACVTTAARNVERDSEVARLSQEQVSGDDSKKEDLSTDSTTRSMKAKVGRAKMEPKASRTPLSNVDLLVRENEELRREKEQLLTQKTDEIYKLKREFYKELERVKGERKKDYESDGSQKESPKSRGPSKPRHQAFTGPETKPNDDTAKMGKVVADQERKVSELTALWDAEKSTLMDSLSQKENEIKELVTNLSSQSQAQKKDEWAKSEKIVADHERKVSEMRALWDAEKSTLMDSLSQKENEIKELVTKLSFSTISLSQAQKNDESAKLEKVVADYERKVSEMRALWDAEKSTLLESLSERENEIKELVTNLSSQSQAQNKDESAKLMKVVADHERKVSEMRALWDTEKSVLEGQIQELVTNSTQLLEKQRERQASLEESLAAVEKERSRLMVFHEEKMEGLALGFRNALDVQTQKLSEAAKYAEEKAKRVSELDDEVRQVKGEISVLRTEISSVRKQMESEFAEEIQYLMVSLEQLESSVTHRTKQYNLRLQRAQSLLNHLVRQFNLLASNETVHMQNIQNLTKAEAEVDLLGDEVDALMDVLEKVYTVLSHYHPVIQHYPGLADLAKVVRNEVLQRLRDSDDVSL